jgi:DNA-directed RNA polymerase specialized sigma24 family protein
MSYEEIGEVIDASPEAARANVYEALRKLRSQFAAALID